MQQAPAQIKFSTVDEVRNRASARLSAEQSTEAIRDLLQDVRHRQENKLRSQDNMRFAHHYHADDSQDSRFLVTGILIATALILVPVVIACAIALHTTSP